MSGSEFFDAPERQSLIKTELVDKYFGAWARVILNARQWDKRIAFVDLFSGPGVFQDGTPSTPIKLLTQVINAPEFRSNVVTVFNDRDPELAEKLQESIMALPNIQNLAYPPRVLNLEVSNEILMRLNDIQPLPTLFFVDPYGYKGLSLDSIGRMIQGWGSECILFFNYNRINSGLNNPIVEPLMIDLFGEKRLKALREELATVHNSSQREQLIVSTFKEALIEVGGRHVLDFKFRSQERDRTSHYIFFITKNSVGHKIMKEIMYNLSTDDRVVRRTEFAPPLTPQLPLFPAGWHDASDPYSLNSLKNLLCDELAGQTLQVGDICERYSVGRPYVEKNVKAALLELESEGVVTVDRPLEHRIRGNKVTLADHRLVTFT